MESWHHRGLIYNIPTSNPSTETFPKGRRSKSRCPGGPKSFHNILAKSEASDAPLKAKELVAPPILSRTFFP